MSAEEGLHPERLAVPVFLERDERIDRAACSR